MVTIIYFELIAESRTFIIVGLVYKCVFRVIDSVYRQHSLLTLCCNKMVMRKYLYYAVHKSLSDETQKYIELRRNKCKNTSVVSRKD